MKKKKKTKKDLKSYNSVIQVCPECGEVDVYLNDGHDCFQHIQNMINNEYYD